MKAVILTASMLALAGTAFAQGRFSPGGRASSPALSANGLGSGGSTAPKALSTAGAARLTAHTNAGNSIAPTFNRVVASGTPLGTSLSNLMNAIAAVAATPALQSSLGDTAKGLDAFEIATYGAIEKVIGASNAPANAEAIANLRDVTLIIDVVAAALSDKVLADSTKAAMVKDMLPKMSAIVTSVASKNLDTERAVETAVLDAIIAVASADAKDELKLGDVSDANPAHRQIARFLDAVRTRCGLAG